MRKIPTVLVRNPDRRAHVLMEVTAGCEWVTAGEGVATRKFDGTCVMLDDGTVMDPAGRWWGRREVKPDKEPPPGFRLLEVDQVTGKAIGWEPIEQSSFARAFATVTVLPSEPGTYELVGQTINRNPEKVAGHQLIPHGRHWVNSSVPDHLPRTPEQLVTLVARVAEEGWEGVVWHHPDGRMAKLKARDLP